MNYAPLPDALPDGLPGAVWNESQGSERLAGLIFAIRRNWKVAASIWLATIAVALALAFLLTPYWRVEIVVMPAARNGNLSLSGALGSGSLGALASSFLNVPAAGTDEAVAVLRSRALFDTYAAQKNLLPVLYSDRWDGAAHRWTVSPSRVPTLRRAYKLFDSQIREVDLDRRTGIVTLSITWKDRDQAVTWARDLIALTNQRMRAEALETAQRSIDFLGDQIRRAGAVSAQNALTGALATAYERELQTYMFAKGNPDYAFRVIDAPTVPDARERVWPKRPVFAALGVILGGFLGVMAAMAAEALRGRRR